ncbi:MULTISPECIES: hypothetical protein [unclassified Curtobacterium]|uniref:hypothetical protein n=1 Tax=unclassified Curtobacterium TaxID=257496 RepID=UPI00226BB6BC|nr:MULTISPECIES: hypothetical protein [unclassified Curtobacterium]
MSAIVAVPSVHSAAPCSSAGRVACDVGFALAEVEGFCDVVEVGEPDGPSLRSVELQPVSSTAVVTVTTRREAR